MFDVCLTFEKGQTKVRQKSDPHLDVKISFIYISISAQCTHIIPNVSHLLLSVGLIAINQMVIKRPASALTQSALDAHGENIEMSLEEKMKRIQEDIFICFGTRFRFICFDNSCIQLDVTWLGWWFKHCHQDPDCVNLSRGDRRTLNMRFSTTVAKRSADATKAWEAASSVGQSGRTGKVARQHEVIKAWLVEPSLGSLFRDNLQEIFAPETQESEEQWMAKKEVPDTK